MREMAAIPASDDVARFYCTKHSWRGKYELLFGLSSCSVCHPHLCAVFCSYKIFIKFFVALFLVSRSYN